VRIAWAERQHGNADLRAYGALLVSSDIRAGVVTYVRIVSEKGKPCTLVKAIVSAMKVAVGGAQPRLPARRFPV
jgi:hypothetical protein